MAHLKLEGSNLVVRCDDGTVYKTTVYVNKDQLGSLQAQVSSAISEAMLAADGSHTAEVDALDRRVAAETATIKGQLTGVPAKEATPKKRIAAPAAATPPAKAPAVPIMPKEAQRDSSSVPPRRSEIDMKWVEARLAECVVGGLKPVSALYGNMGELGTLLASPEQQAAATRATFAALSRIPSFTQYLHSIAKSVGAAYPAFMQLSGYLMSSKSLVGAPDNIMAAATVYTRYFLIDLRAADNAAYAQEISQLPACRSAMEKMQKQAQPPSLRPLAWPMDNETLVAAAAYIRRWSMVDRQKVPEDRVQPWQTPETIAAAQKALPVAPQMKDTLDRRPEKREIRW
ncbi:MAG: hypothetical protein PHV13_02295 [Candidatus ainarchaeum sp.]|nr:hypothetical protein [Candidatus ainarchaeum sp.]